MRTTGRLREAYGPDNETYSLGDGLLCVIIALAVYHQT
jgi:hypothetical protein